MNEEEKKQTPEQEPARKPVRDTEGSVFNLRNFLLGAGSVFILIGLILAASLLVQILTPHPQAASYLPTQLPPEPRLQVAPPQELQTYKATEQARLSTYGWVNKQAGIVHIPIERAMQIIAQSGLPVSGTVSGTVTTPAPSGPQSLAQQGAQLFQSLGCSGCHGEVASAIAPTLHGVFGSQVKLQSGETVTADEAYVQESILNPQAKIVAGYQPIMPSFSGRVNDQQLSALVAYVKSLGNQ